MRETQKGIADVPLFNKRPLKRCKVGSHFLMRHKNGVQLLYPLSSVLMFIKMCARYFFICLLAILTHTIFLLGIYCEISRYCSRDCTTPHLLHTIVCTWRRGKKTSLNRYVGYISNKCLAHFVRKCLPTLPFVKVVICSTYFYSIINSFIESYV